MPEIKISEVMSVSSEDIQNNHLAVNLLKNDGTNNKWKCIHWNSSANVILKLSEMSKIDSIEIGNECSVFVCVYVSRSDVTPQCFQILLSESSFMIPSESKVMINTNRVRMFNRDKLSPNAVNQYWDLIKIKCFQPFNKNVTFGLAFIRFFSPPVQENHNLLYDNIKSESKGIGLLKRWERTLREGQSFVNQMERKSNGQTTRKSIDRQTNFFHLSSNNVHVPIENGKITKKLKSEKKNHNKKEPNLIDDLLNIEREFTKNNGLETPYECIIKIANTQWPNIEWSNIMGHERVKETLRVEINSQMFNGIRKSCKSILLFGHSGTGKSYLGAAISKEALRYTFFYVSPLNLTSKSLEKSEMSLRNVFETARHNKPCIIFIDNIDSLCDTRSDTEYSRLCTEFLFQMKGVNDDIIVFGTTNIPWALNSEIINYFEKRIYIPLPKENERLKIFMSKMNKSQHNLTDYDFIELANRTDGYSCADISVVVRDAMMQPLRKVKRATHFRKVIRLSQTHPHWRVNELFSMCSPENSGSMQMSWTDIPEEKLLLPNVGMNDMLCSLENSKPTVSDDEMKKMNTFVKTFG